MKKHEELMAAAASRCFYRGLGLGLGPSPKRHSPCTSHCMGLGQRACERRKSKVQANNSKAGDEAGHEAGDKSHGQL